ncbi:MAG TPA: type VII secretion protein EccB [Actinophytocola sp.]|uniref:type VII secretion protein EccB n=1 Tax=Actinophytocola sp. TaxID=1872138 RepID=UPI002DDC9574|nr:type VII secretion protein EccB [Actinophytocola sp.]HEV2778796.1 type VII secretion protein EccB [Actinophytocola sp.]
MPSTPTTKSQVQAYRFVLRRMQSALVRKDAVMLHDPMRTHSRATIVGVCIAAVAVVGFLVWGLLSPDPKPPNEDSILISKQSGQVYVLISNPRQLIPTFNLASARLLLVARQQQNQQAQAGGTAGQIPSGSLSGGQGPKEATMVDEKELKDIPRGRMTGIQNGPDMLPGNDARIDPYWAVCDAYEVDRTLPDPTSENNVETTVLAGVKDLGPELAESHALLVRGDDNKVYLVYRTPVTANIKNANAVKAEVNMGDANVKAALKLNDSDVRRITTGLLNAIPAQPPLTPPIIEGRGEQPNGFQVENLLIGQVFQVERAGQREFDYYVMLRGGIELIKRTTADLIRFTESLNAKEIPTVAADAISGVPNVDEIDDKPSPSVQPEILTAEANPIACLGWTVTGEGNSADSHTAVHVGVEVPLPRKPDGTRYESIRIGTPGANGQRIDRFFMPPGRAAVVRGAESKEDFGRGPIYLISDRGVKYGVPDVQTANILGLADQRPAYSQITNLLPDGASLNTRDVLQTYDSVPVQPGVFETQQQQAGGGNGGG